MGAALYQCWMGREGMSVNLWRDLVVWWRSGMPPYGPTVSGKDAERFEQAVAQNERETVTQEEQD